MAKSGSPADCAIAAGDYRTLPLEKLIELKIASGLSAPHRQLVDLADIQRLIEELRLPAELAEELDTSVRSEYRRLWSPKFTVAGKSISPGRAEGPHERG